MAANPHREDAAARRRSLMAQPKVFLPDDQDCVRSLRPSTYEVAARVATGHGSQVRTVTGRTEALPEPTGQAARIRRVSAERYGVTCKDVDAHLRGDDATGEDAVIGRARRQS
jgi:hypothetical protein